MSSFLFAVKTTPVMKGVTNMLNIENVYIITISEDIYCCGEYEGYSDLLDLNCPAFKDYKSAVKYLEDLWPGRRVDEKGILAIDAETLTHEEIKQHEWNSRCDFRMYEINKLILK